MTTWKNDRQEADVKWESETRLHAITHWISTKKESIVNWRQDRVKHMTHKRDYMLGSFFATILTAITDPKDNYALRIKTDPDYEVNSADFMPRVENNNTQWKKSRV